MTWWHGGLPGLPGPWLLPPAVTGAVTNAEVYEQMFGATVWQEGVEADRASRDHVFLTRSRQLARAHAASVALCGRGPWGALYEAIPGALDPDPDTEEDFRGLSVQAPYALIVGCPEPAVRMGPEAMWRIMRRYTTPAPGYTMEDVEREHLRVIRALGPHLFPPERNPIHAS